MARPDGNSTAGLGGEVSAEAAEVNNEGAADSEVGLNGERALCGGTCSLLS